MLGGGATYGLMQHQIRGRPVDDMDELVKTDETSDEVVAQAKAAGEAMGKTVVVVKDSPGFATSRLGLVLGLEAIRMVEEGVATV